MQGKNVYISIVKIAVLAATQAEACDIMSMTLTENLMGPGPVGSGVIMDWQYVQEDGKYTKPQYKCPVPELPIEEDEIFE